MTKYQWSFQYFDCDKWTNYKFEYDTRKEAKSAMANGPSLAKKRLVRRVVSEWEVVR